MYSGSKLEKPSQTCLVMEDMYGKKQGGLHHKTSILLERAASDDVIGFMDAVEKEGHDVGEVGLWYGRRVGSKEVRYEERTPLMIAAMFASKNVLSYILRKGIVDVNQTCGSDGATALHCAVSGGSSASPEVIKLLLDSSADVNVVDANGNKPCDLITTVSSIIFNSRKRVLHSILEGRNDIDEACLVFEEAISSRERHQQPKDVDSPCVSSERKAYHIDLSLPDIKNGVYGTDEFRMYTFKVKPCSRAYSHDWTECPFVHPGENARRRDPTKYHYSCVPCPEFRKGSCSKGDSCEYAHGIFECGLHPAQYRTRLCKDETSCTRKVCFFAHKQEELRPLYASTGSALPSPTSYSPISSSLEMGSLSPFTLASPSSLTSPSSAPALHPLEGSSPSMWQTQTQTQTQTHVSVPTFQLPLSKFRNKPNAIDIDLDIESLGLEKLRISQQLLMDEMDGFSSPSPSKLKSSMPNSLTGVNKHANLDNIFESHQLQSPTRVHHAHHMLGYSTNLSPPNVIGSPSYRVDTSANAAAAAVHSRNDVFPKRSQSFIEHGMLSCNLELPSSPTDGWGSPDGRLDWSIHGEEFNKMRKSASFGFCMARTPILLDAIDEFDVSWVHSLGKYDATPMEFGDYDDEEQHQEIMRNYLNDGIIGTIPSWLDQLFCYEQEQMVA